ncbi:hypothetical protein DYI37_03635 [Fulvimarina endophytica]|uniref:DUF1254 domain-containing protein n=1 Tax=Fulvimarina endophytica TaxID=2293836 RepID=A0A371X704_9HYPH|nr:hypothetical protein [Fulvimarina endophytica]RFC64971.1 hypothetical protein DYI37_03635 [Fulvimarina endophytica]
MARYVLAILIGLVGAGLVHIAIVFMIPNVSDNSAWSRLSGLGDYFEVVRIGPLRDASVVRPPLAEEELPADGGLRRSFAFSDPAFLVASCRFALDGGPVEISANGTIDNFWSASIYDSQGDNLYSINDRAAIGGLVNLIVGTPQQIEDVRATTLLEDSSALPVVVDVRTGYMTIRVLIDEESKRPAADAFLKTVSCLPIDIRPTAAMPSEPGPAGEARTDAPGPAPAPTLAG